MRVILEIFEIVRPDAQGTGAAALAQVAMPSVLDDQPQVGIAGKVDGQLDLGNIDWRMHLKLPEMRPGGRKGQKEKWEGG
jgi:hypothetical protein